MNSHYHPILYSVHSTIDSTRSALTSSHSPASTGSTGAKSKHLSIMHGRQEQ
eukprot:COSAG01_NODE_4771_length_4754_cov_4.582814_1_plen_52_part_00